MVMKYILILALAQFQLCQITPQQQEQDRCNNQCYIDLENGIHHCDDNQSECRHFAPLHHQVCYDGGVNVCNQRCSERHDNCIVSTWEHFDQCLGHCDRQQ